MAKKTKFASGRPSTFAHRECALLVRGSWRSSEADTALRCESSARQRRREPSAHSKEMDTLGFEPRAFRMQSGCDTTTPCARMLFSSAFKTGWSRRLRSFPRNHNLANFSKAANTAVRRLLSRSSMDTLGFEPRAFRMRSGCDTTTPCAPKNTKPPRQQTMQSLFFLSSTLVSKAVPRAETDKLDTLGIEPRAFRMQSGCDTATPCAHMHSDSRMPQQYTPRDRHRANHERFRASSSGYTGIFHPDWT